MKEFNFIWRIENYSFCWHGLSEVLLSPLFIVNTGLKTAWKLGCFPGGENDAGYIGFHLKRCPCLGRKGIIAVNYELSLQAADGTVLKSWTPNGACVFRDAGDVRGVSAFVNRNDVLVRERHRYLAEDTLIARCRMWIGAGIVTETVQCTARTRVRIERTVFVRTFERFSQMQPEPMKSVDVETTSFAVPLMFMNLVPKPEKDSEVRLMIVLDENIRKSEIKLYSCKIYLLDSTGRAVRCGEAEYVHYGYADRFQFPLTFTKTDLMDDRIRYLPLDTLSLQFQFDFSDGILFEEIEESVYGTRLMTEKSVCCINAGTISDCPSALEEDLKSLYDDQVMCDVRLKTETRTFPAHKTVLCARSPVFRAMFENEMKESIKDCVEVEDLEDDTLRQFLLFLYTDKLEDVQWRTASKLYYAADKYQVKVLRNMCSSVLIDNLEVSNASDVLLLADMHQDSDMRKIAEHFILEHDEAVFSSEEWISFTKSSPQLAMDTMLMQYRKK